jgi:hypothetical protein
VLQGAEQLLREARVRDILFEEHGGPEADSVRFAQAAGYHVFRVMRHFSGPRLEAPSATSTAEIDPPTYLATNDPVRARARFARRGWLVLRSSSYGQ